MERSSAKRERMLAARPGWSTPNKVPTYRPRREADGTLYRLTNELVAARKRAGLRQRDVALKMGTTRSAISRLERGLLHRPTLTTIENYALVVDCRLDIHVLPRSK